jgi:hypothetical protein
LSDLDTGSQTLWFTVGTTHTGLKSISPGARKHLVDTEYVVWVHTNAHVEIFLANGCGQVPFEKIKNKTENAIKKRGNQTNQPRALK